MRGIFFFLVLAMSTVLICGGALAAGQPPFTMNELARCLEDTPDFLEYMESQQGETGDYEDPSTMQQLAGHQAAAAWLQKHGWVPQRFSYVLGQMSKGYMALRLRQEGAMMDTQMQEAMKMPDMTPAMKAEMSRAMKELQEAREARGVHPSEMKLIEANLENILNMYESLE